jgi:hypothetical protein
VAEGLSTCPVFVTRPLVVSTTTNSLTLAWLAQRAKSWAIAIDGDTSDYFGTGTPTLVRLTNLAPDTTFTQTVILWDGLKQTGCRVSFPVTGTTDAIAGQATPTPTPVVTPKPAPALKPQVSVKPIGPVRTGDGSLGRRIGSR